MASEIEIETEKSPKLEKKIQEVIMWFLSQGGGGTLIFSSYVGTDPPQKNIRNFKHPKKYLKFLQPKKYLNSVP